MLPLCHRSPFVVAGSWHWHKLPWPAGHASARDEAHDAGWPSCTERLTLFSVFCQQYEMGLQTLAHMCTQIHSHSANTVLFFYLQCCKGFLSNICSCPSCIFCSPQGEKDLCFPFQFLLGLNCFEYWNNTGWTFFWWVSFCFSWKYWTSTHYRGQQPEHNYIFIFKISRGKGQQFRFSFAI